MSAVTFQYIGTGYSKKAMQLLTMLSSDEEVLTNINNIIGTNLNRFVPKKSGALRNSMTPDADGITWSTPYAHFQYMGIVYDENIPRWRNGNIVGWRSIPGMPKVRSNKILGAFNQVLNGWKFGYSTDGTMHHWVQAYSGNQWNQSAGIKAETNKEITMYLKAECKRRGLSV